jgi:molybdopterin biosynthesis enzyme
MPPVEEILSLADAQAAVLAHVRPLDAETRPLADAAGRYLAEPAKAVVDLPPFRSSAMDGYALRSADTPGTLPVVFRVAAGAPAKRALEPGEEASSRRVPTRSYSASWLSKQTTRSSSFKSLPRE